VHVENTGIHKTHHTTSSWSNGPNNTIDTTPKWNKWASFKPECC